MEVDQLAIDKIVNESIDDYDLAENFGFFVEDYILFDDGSHDKYVAALRELPPVIRQLYLVFIAQISVEGDGFQSHFDQIDEPDLQNEVVAGLHLLSRDSAAEAYGRARNHIPFFDQQEIADIVDTKNSEIHSAFYDGLGNDLWEDLGAFIRKNRKIAVDAS